MANAYTTSGWIGMGGTTPHMTPPYYAPFLRESLYSSLYLRQLGTNVTIPRGYADKVRVSKWGTPIRMINGRARLVNNALTGSGYSTTAVGLLGEGTAFASIKGLSAASITGQVTAWGGGRGYSDKMVIVSMANFIEGALESLSRELAFRIDRYDRAKISAGALTASAIKAAGTANTLKKIGSTSGLIGKNVSRIRPLMGANGIPLWDDGTYVGVAHELAAYDMFADTSANGFVSVARYNDARMLYRGEVGEFYGVRWLLSSASALKLVGTAGASDGITGGATATYGISGGVTGSHAYIFGPDAFYNLELETGGVEVLHMPLGSGGAPGDPLAQLGSIGVKVHYGVMPAPSTDNRLMRFVHSLSLNYG